MKSKILYKKTSTGKIQQWRIWVIGSTIHSECGQVDGKKTLSEDEILKAKVVITVLGGKIVYNITNL